jgi:formylglycine-generating enzyme
MIRIPEGWFWMGSAGRFPWESPRHNVYIDAFEIAPITVTRREYAQFHDGSSREDPVGWQDPAFSNPDQPVVGVSWFDAISYCDWLSNASGERYRLPTEAEWEKACRGELIDKEYPWGNEEPASFEYFQSEWKGPRVAGSWRANDFGLFNMGENVHEWCMDWFSESYYANSPVENPFGPLEGTRRVSRGGSWRHQIKASRCAHRSSLPPAMRYTDYGFRIVRQT